MNIVLTASEPDSVMLTVSDDAVTLEAIDAVTSGGLPSAEGVSF